MATSPSQATRLCWVVSTLSDNSPIGTSSTCPARSLSHSSASSDLIKGQPATLRPTALALTIVVAGVGLVRFARVGAVTWRLLWPFAAASVPAAFLAGRYLELDPAVYKRVVGVARLFSAYRLLRYCLLYTSPSPRDT